MAVYDANIIIENIKQLMKQNDISQAKLAEICNSTQSTISKLLTKKQPLTMDFVFRVSDHFKVTIDSLYQKAEDHNAETTPEPFISSEQIGPYEICSCLATIFKSCCQKTKQITYVEDVYVEAIDEDGNETGEFYLAPDTENDYISIFFPKYLDNNYYDAQVEYFEGPEAYGNENLYNRTVNKFLAKLITLQKAFDEDGLDYESYVHAIDQNLAKIKRN